MLKSTTTLTNNFQTDEQMYKQMLMIEIIQERQKKYDRLEAVDRLPSLDYFGSAGVFIGTWSRTSLELKEKFVLAGTAIKPAPELPALVTPSELARTWVDASIKRRLKATKEQINFWLDYHHGAPYMAKRGIYADMVYLDLKSAYWSIMQIVGWGAEYHHDMIVRRHPVDDFPYPNEKLARNSLATVALSGGGQLYKDGRFIETGGKRIVNNGLFYLVNDILHAVAMDMLEFNPVYINTDGFIIPAEYEHIAIDKILNHWGLLMTKRHQGNAHVFGVGSYRIGTHHTKRITQFRGSQRWINEKVPYRMLRKWIRFLADHFPPKYPVLG